MNPGLLKEQYVLITTEPPLQPAPCLRLDLSLAQGSLGRLRMPGHQGPDTLLSGSPALRGQMNAIMTSFYVGAGDWTEVLVLAKKVLHD